MQRPKCVAIVIGSGGAKCTASLGLWKVFQEEGFEVSVAGESHFTGRSGLVDDRVLLGRLLASNGMR